VEFKNFLREAKIDHDELIKKGVEAFRAVAKYLTKKFPKSEDGWTDEAFFDPKTECWYTYEYVSMKSGDEVFLYLKTDPSGKVEEVNEFTDAQVKSWVTDDDLIAEITEQLP